MATKDYVIGTIISLTIIGVLLFGLFFVSYTVLPGFGYRRVAQNELGLKQNDWTGAVDDKVYTQGRHEIGIFASMLKFPKTIQLLSFVSVSSDGTSNDVSTDGGPLNSRTKDGLSIIIELSFTYRLQQLTLFNMYIEMGNDYELYYLREARSTIRDVASLYSAQEFFYNRTEIGLAMHDALQLALDIIFADNPSFDLLNTDLPEAFENAIEQVAVARQSYEQAIIEQDEATVRAHTTIIEAQAAANITVLSAEADAESYLLNMAAQASAMNITLTAQRLAYYAMGQELNLTSSELLALLWIMAVAEHDSSLLIIGADTPVLIAQEFTNSTSPII